MMIEPKIDDLMKLKTINSRYTLVSKVAKRARRLEESRDEDNVEALRYTKSVTMATKQLYEENKEPEDFLE